MSQDNDNSNDYLISKVVRETGADEQLASMLLQFTQGDEQGVFRILSSVPKNIMVLKGKFVAQKRKIYGLFLVYYDIMRSRVVDIQGLVSTERSISRQDVRMDYAALKEFLLDFLQNHEGDLWDNMESEGLLARINEVMNAEYWPKMIEESKKEELEREIIKALDRSLMRYLNDNQLAIKVDTENINEFQYALVSQDQQETSQEQEQSNQQEEQDKEKQEGEEKEEAEDRNIVMLQAEPELAPVAGVEAYHLQKGEEIFVRITDERDVARYLHALLTGSQEQGEGTAPKPIIGRVSSVTETSTGNYQILLDFGPGIMGKIVTQGEVKVKKKLTQEEKRKKEALKKDQGTSGFFFWGLLLASLVLLAVIGVLIFLNQ